MIRGLEGLIGSEDKAQRPGASAMRLLSEVAPHKAKLAQAFALIAVASTAQALGPWLVGRAIDKHVVPGDGRGLVLTLGALLVTYVVGYFATRAQMRRIGAIVQWVLYALRQRLFDRFQALPIPYFDRRPIGDLMSRVSSDVETVNTLFSGGMIQLIGSFIGLLGVVATMVSLSAPLALATCAVIPLMVLCVTALARRARQAFRETRATTGQVMASLQEELGGMREAQAFNRTEENIARFRVRNEANRDAAIRTAMLSSMFSPVVDVLGTLATAVVVGFGAYLVMHGALTVGLLAAFMIYVGQFMWPLMLATQVSAQFQGALAGAERIYAILDEPPEVDTGTAATPGRGRIELRDVGFGYVEGRPVLQGVSFTAEPGQTIAIVGPTGAGKTSIMNLIPRFYDAWSGAVMVDGFDVREMPRSALRAKLAMVPQEPFLFSETVAENLAYGRPGATRDEMEAMAKAVGAHEFIMALPQGYDTPLGEGGGRLGHGQRQLLAIARAMLADRPILLLDEATSHVDAATEAALQKALAAVMEGRTAIVIAHRLSTIRNADMILVVDAGRIVERGTHDELVAARGVYAGLHARAAVAD